MLIFENNAVSIFASQKSDGDLIFKTNDSPLNEQIKASREFFFQKQKINPLRLVNIYGRHDNEIFNVKEKDLGSGALDPKTRIENYDGLVTDVKNSYLAVTGADCFPVIFWDNEKEIIAITHNGWKGALKEIASEAVKKLTGGFGSNLSNINVWIGPGIRVCHFSVPEERAALFSKDYKDCIIEKDGQKHIDLACVIKKQLAISGISDKNVIDSGECTYCETEKYFSYRRDHTNFVNAQMFIIHLK